jgi:hypothetical protein
MNPYATYGATTPRARAIADETGWDLEAYAETRDWRAVGVGPVGQHRDSDARDQSNFQVIYADLSERFPGRVDVVRFGHWGFGWVEEIAWAANDIRIGQAVSEWADALADYPVADDAHYSELEWEENHPSEAECYSDDPECPCEANLWHLEAHDGTGCRGDEWVPRQLTGDTSEITCEACLAVTEPRYAWPDQGVLFAA